MCLVLGEGYALDYERQITGFGEGSCARGEWCGGVDYGLMRLSIGRSFSALAGACLGLYAITDGATRVRGKGGGGGRGIPSPPLESLDRGNQGRHDFPRLYACVLLYFSPQFET